MNTWDNCKPVGQPVKVEQLTTAPGKFPKVWDENIVRLMGKIAIAFAQLEQAVIVVAKRFDKENRLLREFALTNENRSRHFNDWCKLLIKAFREHPEWRAAAETAKCLGRERNALFHGNWNNHQYLLHLPKAGDARLIPLDPSYFEDLVGRICSTRNELLRARPPKRT